MYSYADDIEVAETEMEEYTYAYIIKDKEGEVMALACTEESAIKITEALNAALNPHEKDTNA